MQVYRTNLDLSLLRKFLVREQTYKCLDKVIPFYAKYHLFYRNKQELKDSDELQTVYNLNYKLFLTMKF